MSAPAMPTKETPTNEIPTDEIPTNDVSHRHTNFGSLGRRLEIHLLVTFLVGLATVSQSSCAKSTVPSTPSISVPAAQPSSAEDLSADERLDSAESQRSRVAAITESPPNPNSNRALLRTRNTGVMGTELILKAWGPDADKLDVALDAAMAEIERVEDLMTDWRPSPLTTLNDNAGKGALRVPDELLQIIRRGLEVGRITGGAFDITYAAAGRLWDFKANPPVIPDAAAIREALRGVGYEKIELSSEGGTVILPEGSRIGLGGIAKGYGIDRAMATLQQHGIEHGLVNAGGDMKVLGLNQGQPWEIAIKHPRDREHAIAVLRLSNTCVVTSGDYERFFEHEGMRYHHIIDPRNGYPSKGCLSATVVTHNAELADALATALCVLGPQQGLELIEKIRRCEAIVVGLDEKVHASSGLEGALQ